MIYPGTTRNSNQWINVNLNKECRSPQQRPCKRCYMDTAKALRHALFKVRLTIGHELGPRKVIVVRVCCVLNAFLQQTNNGYRRGFETGLSGLDPQSQRRSWCSARWQGSCKPNTDLSTKGS